MTISMTVIHNGVAEHSTHADERAIARALPIPGWIAARPHEGGPHNLATCEACAVSATIRALRAAHGIDECAVLQSDDNAVRDLQREAYLRDPDAYQSAVNKWLDTLKLVERLPLHKAAPYLRGLRVQAACYRAYAAQGLGAHSGFLAECYEHCADTLWARMAEAAR